LAIGVAQEDRTVFLGEEGIERLVAPGAAVQLGQRQVGVGP
jgi:hypothetical protein